MIYKELHYERLDVEKSKNLLNDIITDFKEAGSASKQIDAIKKVDSFSRDYMTYQAMASLNFSRDINDQSVDILDLKKVEMKRYRKHIQMIFQDPYSSLNPRMLVKDIVKESLDINSTLTENEKIEKVHWLLDKVGLSAEQSNRYPHEFSGGQRQRIGIARALATEPEIVIADEPVSALDVSIQAQIINLMMDLQKEFDLSIIFIAHDLSVVKHISDRVGVMNLGELVEINETGQIFSDPQHDYTKELLRAITEPDPFGREERKRKRFNI